MSLFKRNQYKTVKLQPSKQAKKRTQLHNKVQHTVGTLSGQHTTTLLFQAVQCPPNEPLEEWIAVHLIQFYNNCNDHYSSLASSHCEECSEKTCPQMCSGSDYVYLWRDIDSDLYSKPTSVSAPKYASLALKWCENTLNNEKAFPPQDAQSMPFPKDYLKTYVKEICKKLFRIYAHIYVDHDRQNKKGDPMDFGFKHFMCFSLCYALLSEKEVEPLKNWILNQLSLIDLHRFLKEQKKSTKELLKQSATLIVNAAEANNSNSNGTSNNNSSSSSHNGGSSNSSSSAHSSSLSSSSSSSSLSSHSTDRARRQSRAGFGIGAPIGGFSDHLTTLSVVIVEAKNLGAKDLSGTSDPYVEVRLGKEEFRTSTVWKQLNPVWEENFTFVIDANTKPESSSLSLKVYDQNIIMKGTFIGMCEVDLGQLLDERMQDLWIPLHGASDSESSDHDSRGSIRMRLQYVSSESGRSKYLNKIVQLSHYREMMDYLHELPVRTFIALFDVSLLSQIDQYWKSVLHVAQAKNAQYLQNVLLKVIELEVGRCETKGTLFRANSIASKLISHAVRTYGGVNYLARVLTPSLERICREEELLEVNPAKIKAEDGVDVQRNMHKIIEFAQSIVDAVLESEHLLPPIFFTLIHHLRKSTEEKFSQDENVGFIATSGLLFLRFICPALLSPQLYGLPSTNGNNNVQRNLLMISKIIQQLANNLQFGEKESFMVPANSFIEENTPRLSFFFDSINVEYDVPLPTEPLPDDKLLFSLFSVHELFHKNIDALRAKMMDTSETADSTLLKHFHFTTDSEFDFNQSKNALFGLVNIVVDLGAPPQVSLSARKRIKASFTQNK